MNDAAGALMTELGARGRAGGVVLGFTAGQGEAARANLPKIWKRFRRAETFWSLLPGAPLSVPSGSA